MTDIVTTDALASVVEVTTAADTLVVDRSDQGVTLTTHETETVVLEVAAPEMVVVDVTPIEKDVVLTAGEQGPPGRDGAGGGGVFITDITAADGIVGDKVFNPGTVPVDATLATCVSNTDTVTIHVAADGVGMEYSPVVTLNGVEVEIVESSTKRWFTGAIEVALTEPVTIVTVRCGQAESSATITRASAGPAVLDVEFDAYPGAQTALKSGDALPVTITTAPDAVSVTLTGPAQPLTLAVVGGVAVGVLVMGTQSGAQTFSVVAKNAFGTEGAAFESAPVQMDQLYPVFGPITVTYPDGQGALDTGETAQVACEITNASEAFYAGAGLVVTDPDLLAGTKTVGHTLIGYATPSLSITATRAANGAVSATAVPLKVATVAPTASISITPVGRLVSSLTGADYLVRITPSQPLASAPVMNAAAGEWRGAGWVAGAGNSWTRTLRVYDTDPRGLHSFFALSMWGLSGRPGSEITSGKDYTIGGFAQRTLVFAAFSRAAALGVQVAQAEKMAAQILGGNVLALQSDNANVRGGFYPANADGSYNATGEYLGLSDTALVGANTTGTLQVLVSEAA